MLYILYAYIAMGKKHVSKTTVGRITSTVKSSLTRGRTLCTHTLYSRRRKRVEKIKPTRFRVRRLKFNV